MIINIILVNTGYTTANIYKPSKSYGRRFGDLTDVAFKIVRLTSELKLNRILSVTNGCSRMKVGVVVDGGGGGGDGGGGGVAMAMAISSDFNFLCVCVFVYRAILFVLCTANNCVGQPDASMNTAIHCYRERKFLTCQTFIFIMTVVQRRCGFIILLLSSGSVYSNIL